MSELNLETYLKKMKDILELETELCRQKEMQKVFKEYSYIPVEPVPLKNIATLGMISLGATWVLFDVFAFFMKYYKVAIGASVFTAVLWGFFVYLKVHEKTLSEKKRQEYEEYVEKYKTVKLLGEQGQRIRSDLDDLYEQVGVFPRYRTLKAVNAICQYIESGRNTSVSGAESVYKLYDQELKQGKVNDLESEITCNISTIDELRDYCSRMDTRLDEIEESIGQDKTEIVENLSE